MRIAMIGDNCIDYYEKLNKWYTTGNVVDTGVNMKKLGLEVSLISTTGSDENGHLMIAAMKKMGIDISHLKTGDGPTAVTYMDLDGNERIHGDYIEGVLSNICFDDEDIDFAAGHDLVHSALWGKAEAVIEKIRERSNAIFSFDFADKLDHPIVESTAYLIDYGFFSYHIGRDCFIEEYLKKMTNVGMKHAIATLGEKGSLVFDGTRFYEYGVFPSDIVNTIGAGDSFIAGYLYGILNGYTITKCQELGSKIASEVIGVFGPWVE